MMTFDKHLKKMLKATLIGAAIATLAVPASAETTLRGASMFDGQHAFTKTLVKFGDLVTKYYHGDVKFDLRLNSELGVEKDYVTYLNQGIAIDYTILAPSNMARFAPSIPLMDMPFLFRDQAQWNRVLSSNVFAPLEKELYKKADILIVGYAGGGTRNIISNRKISNLKELAGLKMRVMGAPIQAQVFSAIGALPSAIAYNEVYNAIQTGVVSGLENEASSIQDLKFYEVAPYLAKTEHTITVRPIVFSGKTFRKLPPKLQAAIMKAGKEAGEYGRKLETHEDAVKLKQMADAGELKVSEFTDRDKLLEMVKPVQDKYAASIGATALLEAIRSK